MLDKGDMGGAGTCLRVVRAVEELLDTRPKDQENTH